MRLPRFLTPLSAAAVAALLTLGFQQAASAETRSFQYANFDAVEASAGVKVILKQGPYAVSVEEPEGRFDELKIELKGKSLHVGRKSVDYSDRGRRPSYTITISAPSYSAVAVSSGASLSGEGLSSKAFDAAVSSGAKASLSGSCTSLTVSSSSGAAFEGESLKCSDATVSASSGASASAFASRAATGSASSGARVVFYGSPQNVTKSANSGGSVKAR